MEDNEFDKIRERGEIPSDWPRHSVYVIKSIEKLDKKVDEIGKIKTRVTVLEEREKTRKWYDRVVIGSAIALAGKWVWQTFFQNN